MPPVQSRAPEKTDDLNAEAALITEAIKRLGEAETALAWAGTALGKTDAKSRSGTSAIGSTTARTNSPRS